MNNNLYKILEIDNNCSKEDIRKAYYKLSKKFHPDKNNDIDAHEKFNKIHSAYEILINDNLRNEYIKMNDIEKSNFIIILEKILGQEININELNNYGIQLNKNDLEYLENNFYNFFTRINIIELLDLFKGIINKKNYNNNYSESDNDIYDELCCEYYEQLPIYTNNLKKNIKIDLNINIDDINDNNKKKIKIKRKVNDEIITNTFIFFLNKPYIIYYGLGDVYDNNCGDLIIKLNICVDCFIENNNINNIIWNNDSIIIEKNISLFQFINGIDINFNKLVINNWIPYKNGLLVDINNTLLNNKYIFKLLLLLNINFNNSKENLDILNKYFS
jgi:curved DNA-binding protein CbpA